MRLFEFDNSSVPSLVTALELLRNRNKNKGITAEISTQALINLVNNTDEYFTYSSLVDANNHPAVKNLIKSFNKDKVILHTTDSETETTDATTTNTETDAAVAPQQFQLPVDSVSSMAKRAARNRGAPVA